MLLSAWYTVVVSVSVMCIFSRKHGDRKKRLLTEKLTQQEAKRVKKDIKAAYTLAIILSALIVWKTALLTH